MFIYSEIENSHVHTHTSKRFLGTVKVANLDEKTSQNASENQNVMRICN